MEITQTKRRQSTLEQGVAHLQSQAAPGGRCAPGLAPSAYGWSSRLAAGALLGSPQGDASASGATLRSGQWSAGLDSYQTFARPTPTHLRIIPTSASLLSHLGPWAVM